jgi:hypothetical protein
MDDLPRRLVLFVHIGSIPIVVGLIGRDALVEVRDGGEVLQVEELFFDGPVDGFDVAVVAPGPDGDSFMDTVKSLNGFLEAVSGLILSPTADEFGAVVGLDFHALQRDTTVPQMVQEDLGEQAGVVGGLFVGIGQEHHSGADFAGGVLVFWQSKGLHLGPVVGDIPEFFGIDGQLPEELPVLLDLGQVLLFLVLFSPFMDQAEVFQDPADGLMGTGQLMFEDQPSGPHEGESFSQANDLLFQGPGDLVGTEFGDPGQFVESGQTVFTVTSEPFSDGPWGGMEGPGGGLDALLSGEKDQAEAKIELVSGLFHAYNLFSKAERFCDH